MNSDVQKEFRITGRVQGVGFRFFTKTTAQRIGLSGYVRNMPDGSVTALARGTREQINIFVEQLRVGSRMARVNDIQERDPSADWNYCGFTIQY